MYKVTSAQLIKQFGRYHDAALREPVTVTKHGRDSVVMLSADEYRRLERHGSRVSPAQEAGTDGPQALEPAEFAVEQAYPDEEAQDWMP